MTELKEVKYFNKSYAFYQRGVIWKFYFSTVCGANPTAVEIYTATSLINILLQLVILMKLLNYIGLPFTTQTIVFIS